MNKGLKPVLVSLVFVFVSAATVHGGEIYKVVNPDGSVTYTDQRPSAAAEPVELKPLSVVETDIPVPKNSGDDAGSTEGKLQKPTARDLKRMYRDFRILQPQNEETFWGSGNQVTIAWGASEAIRDDMSVVLYVDGEGQTAPDSGSVTLSFDRGEHQVYAVLRDARNRRVVATGNVTFFVKQHSVNFNRPTPTPGNGP